LSAQARDEVDTMVMTEPTVESPDAAAGRFVLIECADGDFPVATLHQTAEALARKVGSLEGKDTVIWCVYGIVMPITEGPQRYLFLQDGRTALQIPPYEGAPLRRVDLDLLTGLTIQEDGYIGPPDYLKPAVIEERLVGAKVKPEDDEASDDDDDDVDDSVPDEDE
jgi:hypothetical protein